jgi:hypothetical protein
MKHIWMLIKTLFHPHPTDSRVRLMQGGLAGLCGLLAVGLSTHLTWPDDRLVVTHGGGVMLLLTSLMRFLPRYHVWFVAGRAVIAAGVVLTLLGLAFVFH